jgi:hypothetical protein
VGNIPLLWRSCNKGCTRCFLLLFFLFLLVEQIFIIIVISSTSKVLRLRPLSALVALLVSSFGPWWFWSFSNWSPATSRQCEMALSIWCHIQVNVHTKLLSFLSTIIWIILTYIKKDYICTVKPL